MCEHGCRAFHNEGHDGPNIRPKQLRNREVPWEGSHRSKLMSRRTERPYKVDGTGRLARHSEARCSVPEINGPVVQREFTFLLRETCNPNLPATAGARPAMVVAREQESAEAVVPRATSRATPEGLTTREGLNLAGRHDHRWSCPGALKPTGRAPGSDHRGRERVLLNPQGLPGTAVRGPACTVVWEPGGETLRATRFGVIVCLDGADGLDSSEPRRHQC